MPTERNYTQEFDEVLRWDLLNMELSRILNLSRNELEYLKEKSILVTGGSGVIGKWVLKSIYEANKRYRLGMQIYATTRNEKNLRLVSGIDDPNLKVLEIDLTNEKYFQNSTISRIHIDIIIHSAVSSTDNSNHASRYKFAQDISMIKNLISLSSNSKIGLKFIFLSSGVVTDIEQASEVQEILTPHTSMKQEIERLLWRAKKDNIVDLCIIRIYNIYGPGIPLFSKTAIGNFMADGFLKQKIYFESHPESERSYIFIGDLIVQIFHSLNYEGEEILILSSPRAIKFKYLIDAISGIFEGIPVVIMPIKFPPNRYSAHSSDVRHTKLLLKLPRQLSLIAGLRRWKIYLENVSEVEVKSFK